MKIPLAWLNLLHNKARAAVAVAGVAFAVILVLMQLGFYGSVRSTATRVFDALRFDLVLVSPDYVHLAKSGTLPRQRLAAARAIEEVVDTCPLYLEFSLWLNRNEMLRRGILVMAVDPADEVFTLPEIHDQRWRLAETNAVLFDLVSRPEFGPREIGLETEMLSTPVHIAGHFTLGTGFSADGDVLVGDRAFIRLFPLRTLDRVNVGLITLRAGSDPDAAAARLRDILPDDVRVLTRAELASQEREHWVTKTSVGVIFGLGVIVAVIVGVAIVYQVLSSDIANRLPEYATLKAMGYGPRYLSRVVLEQALIMAVAGFVPGVLIAKGLYTVTAQKAHIPMHLSLTTALSVLLLSAGMCVVSGWMSLRKVHSADPADLF